MRFFRIGPLIAAVVLLGAFAPPTSHEAREGKFAGAGTPSSGLELTVEYFAGTVTYLVFDGTEFQRDVDAWVGSDGTYRVLVSSQDGSASEEVAYLGDGTQLVVFTGPGGGQTAARVDGSAHFAVSALGGLQPKQPASSIGDLGVLAIASRQKGHTNDLTLVVPPGVPFVDEVALERAGGPLVGSAVDVPDLPTIDAMGSASASFWDISNNGPCVSAYNNRDNVSNFFTAYSIPIGDCYRAAVSLWEGDITGSGSCYPYWLASSSPWTSKVYATATGYWSIAPSNYACSNHFGWDVNWNLIVPNRGLRASVQS